MRAFRPNAESERVISTASNEPHAAAPQVRIPDSRESIRAHRHVDTPQDLRFSTRFAPDSKNTSLTDERALFSFCNAIAGFVPKNTVEKSFQDRATIGASSRIEVRAHLYREQRIASMHFPAASCSPHSVA